MNRAGPLTNFSASTGVPSRAVLGIDAAWTPKNDSGVALVVEAEGRWSLRSVAASYAEFLGPPGPDQASTETRWPDPARLLERARQLCGRRPDVVAIDMPLSLDPIIGRRRSDDSVSKAYGGAGAGAHTPSNVRPGQLSDRLRLAFEASGYPLSTTYLHVPALIEVYPHPSLIELCQTTYRLPYKIGRVRDYWKAVGAGERIRNIVSVWRLIVDRLDVEIHGAAAALCPPRPEECVDHLSGRMRGTFLKAYEDRLDAVLSAWVGVAALRGEATPNGDDRSAIWIARQRS